MRSVPLSLGSFFGRERELEQVLSAIHSGEPLVTLRGTAGAGKSRLAREVRRLAGMDSVLALLGPTQDDAGVIAAVAAALDVKIASGDLGQQVLRALKERPRVVVLDEAEGVVTSLQRLLPAWLDAAPDARFVVTSRVRLSLPAERIIPVEPLTTAGDAPAVQMLVDRVGRLGTSPGPEDLPTLRALAARVGGIPLALELAASWVALLGARAALARAGELLGLREGEVDLAASISASLRLLAPADEYALRALASLEGTFDLDAAQAVLGSSSSETTATLRRLHDASLLRPARSEIPQEESASRTPARADASPQEAALRAGAARVEPYGDSDSRTPPIRREVAGSSAAASRASPPRFELYTHVRETISEHGGVPPEAFAAKSAYYATLAGRLADRVDSDGSAAATERFKLEMHHLRRVAETGDLPHAFEAARGLLILGVAAGTLDAASRSAQALLARGGLPRAQEAALRAWHGRVLRRLGQVRPCIAETERALALAKEAGASATLALAFEEFGLAVSTAGRFDEGIDALRQAVAHAVASGDPAAEGLARSSLGNALTAAYRSAEAEPELLRALILLADAGRVRSLSTTVIIYSTLLIDQGRADEAEKRLRGVLELTARTGDAYDAPMAWSGLAYVEHLRGDAARTDAEYEHSIQLLDAAGLAWQAWVQRVYHALVLRGRDPSLSGLRERFETCRDALVKLGDERYAALAQATLAAFAAERGELAAAEAELTRARQRVADAGDKGGLALVDAHEAALLRARGDDAGAERRLEELRRTVQPSYERRLVLDSLAARVKAAAPVPRADRLGRWIASADGEATLLEHREPLRGVLRALIAARETAPGRPVDRGALRDAGWPGERMLDDAAAVRIRNAISALRKAGLRDALKTDPLGWYLDPASPLEIVERARPGA